MIICEILLFIFICFDFVIKIHQDRNKVFKAYDALWKRTFAAIQKNHKPSYIYELTL